MSNLESSSFFNVVDDTTLGDSLVTVIANPSAFNARDAISENDRQLLERWDKILARTDLDPNQRAIAERERQKILGNRVDPIQGNGKIFVDEAAKQGNAIINAAGGFVWNTIPGWLWLLIVVAGVSWLGYVFSPFLKAKGVIK